MQENKPQKIGQEEFQSFLFEKEITWQEIIYDLINTEQLDPWDINLSFLAQKYLEKIRILEEANFSLSSKVLLVCSLLLRIKSELLMNRYIKDLDDVLFNNKKEIQQKLDISEIEDEDIPELMPRTPLPRYKKVSLNELMSALSKAMTTENRRLIKKRIEKEQIEKTKLFIPKKTINIAERIKHIHTRIKSLFETNEKIKFSEFAGQKREEKIETFIPLLHLDNTNKLWLHQENHLEEIWIHKDTKKFQQYDDIITNKIESKFEDKLNSTS